MAVPVPTGFQPSRNLRRAISNCIYSVGRRDTVAPFQARNEGVAMMRFGFAIVCICLTATRGGADDPPVAESAAVIAENEAESGFQPGAISIGEPLQVPFRKPDAVVAPPVTAPQATEQAPPQRFPVTPPVRPTEPRPSDAAARSAPATDPTVGTGWLGMTADDTLVPGRLVIVDVVADGPVARAGIVPHDTLLGINGKPLRTSDELAAALAALAPGMTVKMAIGKGDRIEEKSVVSAPRPALSATPGWQGREATVAPPPASKSFGVAPQPAPATLPPPSLAQPSAGDARGRTALGVRTLPVDPGVQARYRLPEQRGAYVIGVVHDLPASKAGVPPGSVIVALDNQPVRDPNDLTRLVTRGPVGSPVTLRFVLPGGESRQADVVLQSLEQPLERALVGGPTTDPGDGIGEISPPTLLQETRRPAADELPPQPSLQQEVLLLRQRVEALERQLDQLTPRRLR